MARSGLRSECVKILRGGGHFQDVVGELVFTAQHKKNQNRCHQTRFLGSQCTLIAFAAGAPPEPAGLPGRAHVPPTKLFRSPDHQLDLGAVSRQGKERKE